MLMIGKPGCIDGNNHNMVNPTGFIRYDVEQGSHDQRCDVPGTRPYQLSYRLLEVIHVIEVAGRRAGHPS